jgi:hypothetical protein
MNAAESDLRGEVALAIMAYLTWAEFHGGATPLLDGTVDRWLCAGKPDDPGIGRALVKLRSQLARYVDHGGHVPEWFPASLLKAIGEPWCPRDLAKEEPFSDRLTDALPARPPTGNARKGAVLRG